MAEISPDELRNIDALLTALRKAIEAVKAREDAERAAMAGGGYPPTRLTRQR